MEKRVDSSETKQNYRTLIRVGDYDIDSIQFQRKYKELCNKGIDSIDAYTILFDNTISAGLLIQHACKLGYEHTPGYLEKLEIIKKGVLEKYLIEKSVSNHLVSTAEIEELLERYPDKLFIDYIWVPEGNVEICDNIFERFQKKEDIDELVRNPDVARWRQAGVKFYKSKPVQVGTLFQKLFVKVYNLKDDELLLKKTQSGYHIIRLIHRSKNDKKIRKNRIDLSRIDLAVATAKENGDLFADADGLKNELWIDFKNLSLINFEISPISKTNLGGEKNPSDSIIAEFRGMRISKKALIDNIYGHSTTIQGFLNNRSTRKQTSVALILASMGYEPYEMSAKRKLKAYISEAMSDNSNELLTRSDSIIFFTEWFDDLLQKFPQESLLEILYKQSNKNSDKFNYLTITGKFDASDLIRPKKYIKLNFNDLESMKTFHDSSINQYTLASGDGWSLSVEDLKKELRKLTPITRIELTRKDNAVRLIRYLASGIVNDSKAMKINYSLLNNIDLIEYSIDSLNSFISESQIIGKLRNVKVTVEELRSYVSSCRDKEKFVRKGTRNKAFKEFIIGEYIIQNKKDINLEDEKILAERLKKYRYQLLSELLYNNKISIGHIRVFGNHIDEITRIAVNKLEQNRLDGLLFQSVNKFSIQVNTSIAENMGIDLSKSTYSSFINKIQSNKELYD